MNKLEKRLLIIGGSLIGIGGLIAFITYAAVGFDFNRILNNAYLPTQTKYIDESYSNIKIDCFETSINIKKSENNKTRIDIIETEKVFHKIEVQDDTLKILRKDNYKWYEYVFHNHVNDEMSIDLYVPFDKFDNLMASTIVGNINIDGGITFGNANVSTNTGNISINNTNVDTITIKSTSGSINTDNLIATDSASLHEVSGNINVLNSDAKFISINSVSGNINCSFLSGKEFNISNIGGKIDIPPNDDSGGICNINTVSSNIKIKIV